MVGRWLIPFLLVLFGTVGLAQTWSQTAILPLPEGEEQDPYRAVRVVVGGDLIAIGDPLWQDRGIVMIRERNAGGLNNWEVLYTIEGDGALSASYGRSLAFNGQELFVAGDHGLWHYVLGNEQTVETNLVDATTTWDLGFESGRLVACGPLVPGFQLAAIKLFEPDPNDGHYALSTGRAIEPISASLSSCMGSVMVYNAPHLIIADPCWQTTTSLPVGGLIQTFQMDTATDTITIDAQPGTYGGYWPFAEGDSLGMNFGRSLTLKGDTLFAGFGPAVSGAPAHVEVFRKNAIAGWDRYTQIHPPTDWTGPVIGDYGTAIEVIGNELVIGTDHGLAFYIESDTGWVFQGFHDLGGAVSAIDHDGDLLAVAVPAVGLVYLYEREATSVPERAEQIQELHIAPNPTSEQAILLPFRTTCAVRLVLLTDAWGREQDRIPWDGNRPLTIIGEFDRSGLSIARVMDAQGNTCITGRIIWVNDPE